MLNFGQAIEKVKQGERMKRMGWNGKNQYIELAQKISYVNARGEIVNAEHEAIGNRAIAFVGTSGVQLGWLASQADMLAGDWMEYTGPVEYTDECLLQSEAANADYESWEDQMANCPLVPVPKHGRLIDADDAIETAWMILRGLGYLREENAQLEQTVREVFATAPAIEVEEHG